MTFIRLGKERESLTVRSEEYKKHIKKYLESRGYIIDSDSGIEGIFEDQIYFKNDRKRVNVECKDTETSLGQSEFLIPFGRYLYLYSKLPEESRFQFSFFVRKVKNGEDFDALFNKLDDTKLLEIKKNCVKALERKKKEFFIEMADHIDKIPLEIVRSFAYNAEIIEADSDSLKTASDIRIPDVGISTSVLDVIPSQKLINGLIESAKPDKVKEKLLSNIFQVTKHPDKIWYGRTNYRSKADVYKDLEIDVLPSFILKERLLYCFWDLNDSENPLSKIVNKDSINKNSTSEWLNDSDKQRWLIELLHLMLKNHAKSKDMRYDRKTSRYYITAKFGVDKIIRWKPGNRTVPRNIVKFYKDEEGETNFAAHRAASFKFEYISNELYLIVDPQWTFTEEGKIPIRDRKMNILSNKWRTREHNSSFLRDVLFWVNFLANGQKKLKIEEGPTSLVINVKPIESELGVGIKDDEIGLDNLLIEQKDIIQPILSFERGQDDLLESEEDTDESESDVIRGDGDE